MRIEFFANRWVGHFDAHQSLTYERKEGLLRQGETGPTKSHYHSNACGWKKTMEKSTLDDCIVVVSFAEL